MHLSWRGNFTLLVGFHDSIHDGVSRRSRLCEEAPTNIVACFPDGVFCGGFKKKWIVRNTAGWQSDTREPERNICLSASVIHRERTLKLGKKTMEISNFVAKLLVAFWLAMLKMDSLSDFNSWHSSISAELERGEEQYGTLEEQPAHARKLLQTSN